MKKFLREFLIEIILVALFMVVWFTVIGAREVFQTSMEPNFHEGQRILINKATYWSWIGEPHRGDVVVIRAPNNDKEVFIKRVIALPGDTVEIVRGTLYVNDVELDEPYVKLPFTYSYQKTTIPDNGYFVLGDNRDISNDSHLWGVLPGKDVVGKVFLIYWPSHSWGLVPRYPLGEQLTAAN